MHDCVWIIDGNFRTYVNVRSMYQFLLVETYVEQHIDKILKIEQKWTIEVSYEDDSLADGVCIFSLHCATIYPKLSSI